MTDADLESILSLKTDEPELSKLLIGEFPGFRQNPHFHLHPDSILNPSLDAQIPDAMLDIHRKRPRKRKVLLTLKRKGLDRTHPKGEKECTETDQ
jgi:hypothetical protein